MLSNKQRGALIAGPLATALVAFLLYASFREGSSPSLDLHEIGPREVAKIGVHIDTASKPRLIIEEPKPGSRYQISEAIHIKGRLDVPKGLTIFEREVYLQNLGFRGQTPAALSSCVVPLVDSDGHYTFEMTLKDPTKLARKPGAYEIKITGPTLLVDVPPGEMEDEKKFEWHEYPDRYSASVRYQVIRRATP